MYEERKETFSFKSFFLTVLVVLLFTFLMLWLFPTRNYHISDKQQTGTYDLNRLSVLYDEIFANNVGRMKDAAIGYYTNERMPQVVGQSKKLTLQEMYDLHLVLKMKDIDGNACHVTKSYVQITKYTEEYRLKVNLSCGDQEDYIIVYLGCYSYCEDGICEKTHSVPSDKTREEENKYNPEPPKEDPEKPDVPDVPVIPGKKYKYEYKLVTDPSTTCTAWSKWQKDPISEANGVSVEKKTENEIVGYDTITVTTIKTETITKNVIESYIKEYTTKKVLVGTREERVGTTTQTIKQKVPVGTVEQYSGIGTGTKVPEDTATKHYKVISGPDKPESCSSCTNESYYTWEIYTVETVYDIVTTTKEVPVFKTVNVYKDVQEPVWGLRTVQKQEQVQVPVKEEKKVPKYGNVVYYRSKKCSTVPGTTDIKWSYSKNDTSLLNKGYKLTGNVKEI